MIGTDNANGEFNIFSETGFEVSSSVKASELAQLLHVGSTISSGSREEVPCSSAANDSVLTVAAESTILKAAQDKSQEVAALKNLGDAMQPADLLPMLTLVDSNLQCGVVQPLCLHQWHGNPCGHHALFSVQCLLDGQLNLLQSYPHFWRNMLSNMQVLAQYGQTSGRWPASQVTKGVVDEVHLQHLVDTSDSLRGRVTIHTYDGGNGSTAAKL